MKNRRTRIPICLGGLLWVDDYGPFWLTQAHPESGVAPQRLHFPSPASGRPGICTAFARSGLQQAGFYLCFRPSGIQLVGCCAPRVWAPFRVQRAGSLRCFACSLGVVLLLHNATIDTPTKGRFVPKQCLTVSSEACCWPVTRPLGICWDIIVAEGLYYNIDPLIVAGSGAARALS